MPRDPEIRFHTLVIIHVHELNCPILKIDMGITHSRTEWHTKAYVNHVKEPINKILLEHLRDVLLKHLASQ